MEMNFTQLLPFTPTTDSIQQEWLRRANYILDFPQLLGMGTRADIYGTQFPSGQWSDICLKENVRSGKYFYLQNSLLQEGWVHHAAWTALNKDGNRGESILQVPVPYAYFRVMKEGREREFLLMQTIQGHTLWRKIMEAAIHSDSELHSQLSANLPNLPDWELERYLLQMKERRGIRQSLQEYLFQKAQSSPFLNESHLQWLSQGLAQLHGQGIYHRDLHVKNLMFTVEGHVWMIDFGTSVIDAATSESEILSVCEGEQTIYYQSDRDALETLKLFIQNSEEEIRHRENQERQRDLQYGLLFFKQKFGLDLNKMKELSQDDCRNIIHNLSSRLFCTLQAQANMGNYDYVYKLLFTLQWLEWDRCQETEQSSKVIQNLLEVSSKPQRFQQILQRLL